MGPNMNGENSQISVTAPGNPVRFTVLQLGFIKAYLGDAKFNGAKAARMAGYSTNSAREMAYENLAKPHIAREIKRRLDFMGLSEGEVRSRLGQMARGEIPTKTVDKDGEITVTYDERQALENVARIHGMFVDRHQVQPVQALLIEDAD